MPRSMLTDEDLLAGQITADNRYAKYGTTVWNTYCLSATHILTALIMAYWNAVNELGKILGPL